MGKNSKKITISGDGGLWLLFRALVCNALEKADNIDLVGNDAWGFSGSLDMSFDEIKNLPVREWRERINKDLAEFIKDVKK